MSQYIFDQDNLCPFPLSKGNYDTSPKMEKLFLSNGQTCDGLDPFVFDKNFLYFQQKKIHNLLHQSSRCRVAKNWTAYNEDIKTCAQAIYEIFSKACPDRCRIEKNTAHFLQSKIKINLDNLEITYSFAADAKLNQQIFDLLKTTPDHFLPFDLLALHMQEDFAISKRTPNQALSDFLELAHICFPSHWDPQKKVGKNFTEIHKPVANNQKLLAAHENLVNAMFEKGPFSRFVWGVCFSSELDRHPNVTTNDPNTKNLSDEELFSRSFLRVERQVTYPLPKINRSFFTIRVFLRPLKEFLSLPQEKKLLCEALASMNEEALVYKNLSTERDRLLDFFASKNI